MRRPRKRRRTVNPPSHRRARQPEQRGRLAAFGIGQPAGELACQQRGRRLQANDHAHRDGAEMQRVGHVEREGRQRQADREKAEEDHDREGNQLPDNRLLLLHRCRLHERRA
ncbi:hypothetical protein [Burkholderia gladioli]|uniref:hypothetical protein n=1 Tax=Burkholderia gladioli TaxID=28095 RepID=UPI0022D33B40|nr:hypothetical protein [Burkholderia gladioli]MDA0569465.1 hypothetical protein [Burkholderia gladioli]MDA0598042.1 hypothetical protein [Burkholderia gladioli]